MVKKNDLIQNVNDCFEEVCTDLSEGAMKELVTDEPEFDYLWTDWIDKQLLKKGRGEHKLAGSTMKTAKKHN